MSQKESSKSFDFSYLHEVYSKDIKDLNPEHLVSLMETGYGEYIAEVIAKEWEINKLRETIDMLELEHGKSLALLIKDEIKNIQLEELNKKLTESTAIYEKDMKMAANVQKSLLFKKPPETENFDVAFYFQAYASVAGDFYDFYVNQDNLLTGLILADVSGHGIASGLLTALAKPIFFRLILKNPSQPLNIIMDMINREIIKEIDQSYSFLTAVSLRFKKDTVEYVNGAHPDIVYFDSDTGKSKFITEENGPLQGSLIGLSSVILPFEMFKFTMKKDDFLIIYTDCVTESLNKDKVPFGKDGMLKTIDQCSRDQSSQGVLDSLLNSLMDFTEGVPLNDDLTIIVLKKKI